MKPKGGIKRELEVAFSKRSQSIGFRIAKYIVFGGLLYFFRGSKLLWIILPTLFVLAIGVHCWYRHKTHGWTRSYGSWKYDKDEPEA